MGGAVEEGAGRALFFSYAHADLACARSIIAALEHAGYTVWWDDQLQGGSAYADRIEQALDAAKAVLVLWSPTSVKSHWVRDEAESGRDRGVLVPLVTGGVQPPIGFRQIQAIDLDNWRGHASAPVVERIIAAIERRSDDAGSAPLPVRTHIRSGLLADRRTWLIAGGAVVAAGVAGTLALGGNPFTGASTARGVAVLPFRNLTGDADKDYLSAGLSEEIRAMLARNPALRIVARASCEAVASKGMEAVAMARELAVSHILDGTLRRAGQGVAVAVELVDGSNGFAAWSADYEGQAEQILGVERAILDAVVDVIAGSDDESEETGVGSTDNPAAFDAYLKGNALALSNISVDSDLDALAEYDRAIELDRGFGAAHAARARILTVLGNSASSVAAAQGYYRQAEQSARAAVAAAPALADAHSTLGLVLFQAQLRVADAREPYERSYELGRGDAAVVARYANYAAQTGRRDRAREVVSEAVSLDPLNPAVRRSSGFIAYAAGRYEDANAAVREALRLNPDLSDAYARIGMGLVMLGRPREAVAEARQESFGLVRETCLAIAYHRLGDGGAAQRAMDALVAQYGDAGLYQQAQVLASWGRADEAMATLLEARTMGDSGLTYLDMDPTLDPLRKRPDFIELAKSLGYE